MPVDHREEKGSADRRGRDGTHQNIVDGYLVTISKVCQERYKDNSDVPEPEGNEPEKSDVVSWQQSKRKDERRP